uniref:Sialate O-acetylesterase-like n=1 Tax=Salarias fasciatus TaxID=181472 RepID=A0A672ITK3_SALFA
MSLRLRALFILTACLLGCDAKVRLASYYGDHMVLQKSPARAVLWGYGPEGAHVTVSLSGPIQLRTSPVTVTKGIWRVTLDPVEPGGPYMLMVSSESNTITLKDVLFGDIWVCGGQSNMQFQTSRVFNASSELALAPKYPHVRPFQAALNVSETELPDLVQVQIPWSVPTAGVMSEFSAVCWLFGRYLYDVLKYPIGLVESCWGGTPVEAWSSSRALQQCKLDRMIGGPRNDSILWNSMIHPLLNMTIYGAIWYQGEANTDYHPNQYNCSFPAMIDDWRMAFHQGSGGQTDPDFPFGFVQLSTCTKNSTSEKYPDIRWHQTADTGFVPNSRMKKTFMAVALDLPDESSPYGTIHPRDKQDVAYRLMLGARAVAYNQTDVLFLGPFPKEIQPLQNSIEIVYDQEVSVTQSEDIYEICCSTTRAACSLHSSWVPAPILSWALASVRISTASCQGSAVAGLRYAWQNWPCDFKACPVYSINKVLPAPPFIFYYPQGNN